MDALSDLINLLNDKDKVDFKAYLKHKNKRQDVKNIRLFELIQTDDINAINKLYGKLKNRDSYHALRKRLHDSLLLFISQRTFERGNQAVYELLRYLVVGRYLLENNLTKLGFRSLDKAERIATENEEYNLLQEILLLKLQFAHLNETIDLEELSKRFIWNQTQIQREAKMQLAYAQLRKELIDIQLKGKVIDLTQFISETIQKYKISMLDFMNYKSLYQVLYLANEYAAINQNFKLVEKYVSRSYQFIEHKSEESDVHTYYKLYILYFLANFNFRNRNYAKSTAILDQISSILSDHPDYKGQFYYRQQLLYALNLHFSGHPTQALETLDHALKQVGKNVKMEDAYDLQICLVMFQTQHHDRQARAGLLRFHHSDAWLEKKMGMLWSIRKSLLEILVYGEFEETDLASARIKSFRRRYRNYLLQTKEEKVLNYVSLLENFFTHPSVVHKESFQQKVYTLLALEENSDLFNLSFIAWLVARWEKATAYEVTMEILKIQEEEGVFSPTKMP